MMRAAFPLFVMALTLVGCHRNYLSVRSQYLDASYLASRAVKTPNPDSLCGQQIVVRWRVPSGCTYSDLQVTVRYGNTELETLHHTITRPSGYYTYSLTNDCYWEKQGIVAFKVELIKNGRILDEWRHHVWADLIEVQEEEQ